MKKLIIATVVLLASATANAESLSIKDYENKHKNTEEIKLYIGGMGAGLTAANAVLVVEGREPLYCQPEKLSGVHPKGWR